MFGLFKDRAPRGGNREGFITILENSMTRIHFLYFPVEELSENGATIAVQRNSGGKKNVKAWWWVVAFAPFLPPNWPLVEVGDVNSS